MEIRPVKTAVVGCGMVSRAYLHNLTELFSIIEVVAVSDLNRELAEQACEKFGVSRIMTAEEIAADPEIELVVNLTAAAVHYDIVRMMLLAGKHVYTEKTMASELWQARELVRLADEKKLYLGAAPDTVLGASIQTARWAVDRGLIGKVTSCVASTNRNQGLNSEKFRFLRGGGGALPYDVGIYYLAALLEILGPVSEVTGFGVSAPAHERQFLFNREEPESWEIPGNNLVAGSLKFVSGALGMLHFDGNTMGAERSLLRIYGTEGMLELGDPSHFGDPVTLARPESEPCILPMSHGYNGRRAGAGKGFEGLGSRGVGVAEMAWAIRRGRPCRMNKEMGLHALEVLAGLDEAARTGQVYHVQSTFTSAALRPGYYSAMWGGSTRADAEMSLVD